MSLVKDKFKDWQIRWKDPLGLPECPYMIRWVLNTPIGSLRIHKWLHSDDTRFFHDHPWSSLILCVKGGYIDVFPEGEKHFWSGQLRFMKAEHKHFVVVDPKIGAITVLLCGPPFRKWGFWIEGKLKRPLEYFKIFRHHPCE